MSKNAWRKRREKHRHRMAFAPWVGAELADLIRGISVQDTPLWASLLTTVRKSLNRCP